MRPLLPLAAALFLVALAGRPASGGFRKPATPPPPAVLLTVFVSDNATRTMPLGLWRKLATEYVGGRIVASDEGTAVAEVPRCRAAHAQYGVLATFERAPRLPGLGQDVDRLAAVARFTVRNCATGAIVKTKAVALESDPLSDADRDDREGGAERTWERAIRATLARNPLDLVPAPAPK